MTLRVLMALVATVEGEPMSRLDTIIVAVERLGIATFILLIASFGVYRLVRWVGSRVERGMERLIGEEKGIATLWVGKQIETMDKLCVKADEQSQTNKVICERLEALGTNDTGTHEVSMRKLEDIHTDVKHVKGSMDSWTTVRSPIKPTPDMGS